jgi:UDP:flavonoid glycosyltransferase YjiC (YdhE family)
MRVLFTTTPGPGHIHPMVPLATAFRAAGHDVAWAVADEVAPKLRREGFEVFAAGRGDIPWAEFEQRFPGLREMASSDRPELAFARVFGAARAEPMIEDLLPLARRWQPALVVNDQAELAGPIAAAALGIPSVTHAHGSALPRPMLDAAGEITAPLWRARGLEPRPFAGTYEHLYLDIYPPSLQTADMSHIPAVQPLRPVAFATRGEAAREWRGEDRSRPLVYVTFGTVFNRDTALIGTVVEALRELPVHIVVTLGPDRDVGALGDQPPNVEVSNYIPQTEFLPRCAAVVSHAGSGTFLAAIGYGLPQLLIPQGADQHLNAASGAGSGACIAIQPAEVTVERVRDAARRLLDDPAFRAAAAGVSDEIAAMPAPEAVVDELARRFDGGA